MEQRTKSQEQGLFVPVLIVGLPVAVQAFIQFDKFFDERINITVGAGFVCERYLACLQVALAHTVQEGEVLGV